MIVRLIGGIVLWFAIGISEVLAAEIDGSSVKPEVDWGFKSHRFPVHLERHSSNRGSSVVGLVTCSAVHGAQQPWQPRRHVLSARAR